MITRTASKATVLALGAAALMAFAPAHAQDAQPASRTVGYADLDLATPAGADQLKRRVTRAASVVCGNSGHVTLAEQIERSACRSAALAAAEPQMRVAFAQAAQGARYADAGAAVIGVRAR